MNVYLIRHGESIGNTEGKIQGWMDFPLSKLGEKQSQILADYLKEIEIDQFYSSDLSRALETARVIGDAQNKKIKIWDAVREVNLGPLQGLTRQEIYEKFPETVERSILTSGVIGTESVEEMTSRCKLVHEQLKEKHASESVAIISHGGFISVFLMFLITGEKWHFYHRPFQITNASITHIEWRKNVPFIHYTNRTEHLNAIHLSNQRRLL